MAKKIIGKLDTNKLLKGENRFKKYDSMPLDELEYELEFNIKKIDEIEYVKKLIKRYK